MAGNGEAGNGAHVLMCHAEQKPERNCCTDVGSIYCTGQACGWCTASLAAPLPVGPCMATAEVMCAANTRAGEICKRLPEMHGPHLHGQHGVHVLLHPGCHRLIDMRHQQGDESQPGCSRCQLVHAGVQAGGPGSLGKQLRGGPHRAAAAGGRESKASGLLLVGFLASKQVAGGE
jgi:hypothetical protein